MRASSRGNLRLNPTRGSGATQPRARDARQTSAQDCHLPNRSAFIVAPRKCRSGLRFSSAVQAVPGPQASCRG